MKKSDLKTGMWVETRDGKLAMVLLNTENGNIISGKTWMPLDSINENLEYKYEEKNYDIVKIYQPIFNRDYLNDSETYENANRTLIWEREKPTKEISSTEAFAILKQHYGCDVKISEVEQ
jgi:hypothetical protein